jgi:hypothetical protein
MEQFQQRVRDLQRLADDEGVPAPLGQQVRGGSILLSKSWAVDRVRARMKARLCLVCKLVLSEEPHRASSQNK